MEVTTVFSLLSGLGLFLFGIKTMGDGLEQAAGSKMKRLLEALTRNKLTAVLVGLLVTAVIQSSSATTVMPCSGFTAQTPSARAGPGGPRGRGSTARPCWRPQGGHTPQTGAGRTPA